MLGIAAPGGPVDPGRLEAALAGWRAAGFQARVPEGLLARHAYLAGDDEHRAGLLSRLVADPEVDAVLCARGGYGCDRILPRLDPQLFRRARKPLVGYSDVTALLLWQQRRAGLAGFHGPMLDRGEDLDPEARASLVSQLCGELPLPFALEGSAGGGGRASGRLVGGSLTLVAASVGTPWQLASRGSILMLEDTGERPYRIDRMLRQLAAAGLLRGLAGIGLGDFSSCVDERYPELPVDAVFRELLEPLRIPWVAGLPFGHVRRNLPWPVGARATLDGRRGELLIQEQGVTRAR